ncbi:MAG: carboxypeptidase regulatory-like domain-containing protein [Chitinispirillaceae bacterium]|nr:carboxypeptidase regulatory-like domain-containing protein [Chitinispirillaceae bacterium]
MMEFNTIKNIGPIGMLVVVSAILFPAHSQILRGRVIDEAGSGIEEAFVELANAVLSTKSENDGTWKIPVPKKRRNLTVSSI